MLLDVDVVDWESSISTTICNVWLRLVDYDENYSQSKCEWVNQQSELIFASNRHALKRIKHGVEKSVFRSGDKDLEIPIGNLVLLLDHLEGWNKIQDHYKSNLFVVKSNHCDPNVYKIKPLCGKCPCVQNVSDSCSTF